MRGNQLYCALIQEGGGVRVGYHDGKDQHFHERAYAIGQIGVVRTIEDGDDQDDVESHQHPQGLG
jgi:hypothetical protein